MLRDLIQDHPEFEACVNLLSTENAFSHFTGIWYSILLLLLLLHLSLLCFLFSVSPHFVIKTKISSYNCTKALKIYNHSQHRRVQALENYNNKGSPFFSRLTLFFILPFNIFISSYLHIFISLHFIYVYIFI